MATAWFKVYSRLQERLGLLKLKKAAPGNGHGLFVKFSQFYIPGFAAEFYTLLLLLFVFILSIPDDTVLRTLLSSGAQL